MFLIYTNMNRYAQLCTCFCISLHHDAALSESISMHFLHALSPCIISNIFADIDICTDMDRYRHILDINRSLFYSNSWAMIWPTDHAIAAA